MFSLWLGCGWFRGAYRSRWQNTGWIHELGEIILIPLHAQLRFEIFQLLLTRRTCALAVSLKRAIPRSVIDVIGFCDLLPNLFEKLA